jgi:hypothetical protein
MTTNKRSTPRTAAKLVKPTTSRRKTVARNTGTAPLEQRRGAAVPAKRQTKKAIVAALLGRPEGASLDELTTATGWQPHSIRATLTGLRKTGQEVARHKDDAGTTRYRLTGTP